ncbi:MAG: hypothetical protein EXR81_04125 [Gammaproteobacteria bacterium]|nr:hypothetical protein [Gammaproteobacteria bacterium]
MKTLITILSSLFMVSAFAATNPTAPSAVASEGTLNVQVQVGAIVQITKAQDMTINQWNGATTTQTQNLCVFSNNIDGYKYTIQFSDLNGNFTLKSGTETLPYSLKFNNNDIVATTGTTTALQEQVGSDSTTCNGDTNATLEIKIPNANGVHAGRFTDTLSLIVTAPT